MSASESPASANNTKNYTQAQLERAVKLVKQKQISLNKASIIYRIPKGTLYNKVNGKVPVVAKKGPKTFLTNDEEQKLEQWILHECSLGYPLHPNDVKTMVQSFLATTAREKIVPVGFPGDKWMKLFLKRHPQITKRTAEVISKARAAVTEESLKNWFDEVHEHLESENQLEILNDPTRVFNLDETGVQLCPKTGKILALKNYRNTFEVASGKEKESVTVLCNFSADGTTTPPFIVFPGKRFSKDLTNQVPEHWAIGRSDSGWMVAATFEEYMKNVFHPWLIENKIKLPVIVFMDGHKSHVGLSLHEFCAENKIILYCLHPNATHLIQPCDVSIFKAVKVQWREDVRKYKHETQKSLTKAAFPALFAKSFEKSVNPTIIKNGFRRCGLFPFDKNAVDYTKCMSNRLKEIRNQKITHVVNIDDYFSTIKVLENEIGPELKENFAEARKKKQNHEHSLFKLWNKCKEEVEYHSNQNSRSLLSEQALILEVDGDAVEKSIDNTQPAQHDTEEALIEDLNIDMIDTFVIDGVVHSLMDNMSMLGSPPVISTPIDFNESTFPSPEKQEDQTQARAAVQIEKTASQVAKKSILEKISKRNDPLINNNLLTKTGDIYPLAIPLPWYPESVSVNENTLITSDDHSLSYLNSLPSTSSETLSQPESIKPTATNLVSPKKKTKTKIDDFLTMPKFGSKASTIKTNKRQSPMPLAITSKRYKEFMDEKEREKKEQEEAKEKRKKEREAKKNIKLEQSKSKLHKKTKTCNINDVQIKTKTHTKTKSEQIEGEIHQKDLNFGDVAVSDYVYVTFETNKRPRHYVGVITEINNNDNKIKVNYLRKKSSKFDNKLYFVEPDVKDVSEIGIKDIKYILPKPQIARRGMLNFDCQDNEKIALDLLFVE